MKTGKPVEAVIREYHDYIACNQYEIVIDPTVADIDRILRESRIELVEGYTTDSSTPVVTPDPYRLLTDNQNP